MPPQTSRYPAAGDASEPAGRHRRPESLADLDARGVRATGLRTAVIGTTGERPPVTPPVTRPAAARAAARHQRAVRPGRHAAPRRPPVTGSHRAPGTLPIESWLLLGRPRRQMLLASLVAIGLLVFTMPAEQRRQGVDAVNAAAQRAIGVSAPTTRPAADPPAAGRAAQQPPKQSGAAPKPTRPAATTAPAGRPTTTAAPATAPARQAAADDLGPGRSLRLTGSHTVALTFDDGPDPVQTPRLLAMLAQHRVRATFCLVGVQVERHPEIVRQIAAAGHALCNHTWDHSLTIGQDTPEAIRADLDRTAAAIRAAVPDARIPFFRAPGGNFTERLVTVAGQAGMTSLYWQVDPRDWDHPTGESPQDHVNRVVSGVQRAVRPGAIVLSHDFHQPATLTAYESLLPWLAARFRLGIPAVGTTPPAVPPSTPAGSASPAPTVTGSPQPGDGEASPG